MRRLAVIAVLPACLVKPTETSGTSSGHIDFVQSVSDKTNAANSVSVTMPMQTRSHDLLLAFVGAYPAAALDTPVVGDLAGNAYLQATSVGTTPAGTSIYAFYVPSARSADGLAITATVPGAKQVTLAVHEYQGASRTNPLDQAAVATGNTNAPRSPDVAAGYDDELFVGVLSHDATTVTSAGPGYTLREVPAESNADVPLATEDQLSPASRTAPATFALQAVSDWTCMVLTFH